MVRLPHLRRGPPRQPIKPRTAKSGPRITTRFGVPGGWIAGHHTGTDYAGPKPGDKVAVRATYKGRVERVAYDPSYGRFVVVRHRFRLRRRWSWYCHLSEVTDQIKVGALIPTGALIGITGDTGNANGVHLHYEERVGKNRYADHRKPILPAVRNAPTWLKKRGWF